MKSERKKRKRNEKKTISRLNEIHLVFEKEARSQGQLFGSVSSGEISKALEEKHNLFVDKKDIFSDPLKTIGKHKIKIALDSKRETFLSITVKKTSSMKENPETPTEASHYSKNSEKEASQTSPPSSNETPLSSSDLKKEPDNSAKNDDEKKIKPPD